MVPARVALVSGATFRKPWFTQESPGRKQHTFKMCAMSMAVRPCQRRVRMYCLRRGLEQHEQVDRSIKASRIGLCKARVL